MGKKGGWFSAVRKAISYNSKEHKEQKKRKSKQGCFGKHGIYVSNTLEYAAVAVPPPPPPPPASPPPPSPPSPPLPPQPQPFPVENVKLTETVSEQNKRAYSMALVTAMAAEAAAAAARAAAEVVRLSSLPRYPGKSKEEIAAIKIQTFFRGYLARRALRASRGLIRLKTLLRRQSIKRQATTTLRCMQTLTRVQSQIRSRRIRMSEENQAFQRQILRKREKELDEMKIGEGWDDSPKSKEQIEARLQNKQEAAMRRERALAYSFSHQQTWRNTSKYANPTFMDPSNPHWGWSWLERWMSTRPWDTRSTLIDYNDRASIKSTPARNTMSFGEIAKSFYRRDLNLNDHKSSPTCQKSILFANCSGHSPSTATSKAPLSSSLTGKTPKGKRWCVDNEDSRSVFSVQSERYRRHSMAGFSVRDDESISSSPYVPSYMASTKSAKARSKHPSPLGLEKNMTPKRGSINYAKKRHSFSTSNSFPRRHSGTS